MRQIWSVPAQSGAKSTLLLQIVLRRGVGFGMCHQCIYLSCGPNPPIYISSHLCFAYPSFLLLHGACLLSCTGPSDFCQCIPASVERLQRTLRLFCGSLPITTSLPLLFPKFLLNNIIHAISLGKYQKSFSVSYLCTYGALLQLEDQLFGSQN